MARRSLHRFGALLSAACFACGDASSAATDDEAASTPVRDAATDRADASRTHADAGATQPAKPVLDAAVTRTTSDGGECTLGEASSFATDDALSLFGDIVYFAKGRDLPAGHYRVAYVDGCMKYNFLQPWRVNQDTGSGPDGWWLVGATTSDRIVLLPGEAGSFLGGYSTFSDCVAGNQKTEPKEFDFAGGKLGVWLNDNPYVDNLSGENGDNPRWQLTLLAEMCPPNLVLL